MHGPHIPLYDPHDPTGHCSLIRNAIFLSAYNNMIKSKFRTSQDIEDSLSVRICEIVGFKLVIDM